MKKTMRRLLLSLLLLLAAALCGCGGEETEEPAAEASTQEEENVDDSIAEVMAESILDDMTLEEKIGQMFILCTDSLDFSAETEMTEKMRENLEKYQPGGVIFFSFNIENREQVSQFITDMQAQSKIPMFIGVDEEGGSVARVANTEGMGTTVFPSMSEIGAAGDASEALTVGETIGREIGALGFNLDFAPVADLASADNEEVGERSFGTDASLVSSMVRQEVTGLQSEGVSATLKHFPGQGQCEDDTHKGYAELDVTIKELRQAEFKPFEAGIAAGADFVMVSHVSVGSITGSDTPASLSELMVSDILRGELEFEGIIVTDAMNMKIITKFYDADQAALLAVEAGNDMILMPDNFEDAYNAVLEAVQDGTLSEERIDESVTRILTRKIRREIIAQDSPLLAQ